MAKITVVPLDRPDEKPREISARLRSQLVYFVGTPGPGDPVPGEGEYWFATEEIARWLDEGVFHVVSPLDTDNQTEVELSEEQESFLGWLQGRQIRHVRVDW